MNFEEKLQNIQATYDIDDLGAVGDPLNEPEDDDVKSQMTESTNPDFFQATEIEMTRSGAIKTKMGGALFVKSS